MISTLKHLVRSSRFSGILISPIWGFKHLLASTCRTKFIQHSLLSAPASRFLLSVFSSALIFLPAPYLTKCNLCMAAMFPCLEPDISVFRARDMDVASKEHWKLNGRRHVLRPTVSRRRQKQARCTGGHVCSRRRGRSDS